MAARYNNTYSTYGKGSGRKYRSTGRNYGRYYRNYQRRVRGKGGYIADAFGRGWRVVSKFSRQNIRPFQYIGNKVGAKFGPLGSAIGDRVGSYLGKVTGLGEYKRRGMNLGSRIGAQDPPVVANRKDGVIISHREFLGNIMNTTTFNNTSYQIQPGDPNTFPWLSTVATSFEQYQMLGCLFEFISTSTETLAASNPALGTIMMATDYNAAAPPYSSEVQMLNSEYATSNKPSCSFLHAIECSPHLTSTDILYISNGGVVPTGADPRLYNLGLFQIASSGSQSGNLGTVGQLWVTYQVKLLKPQLAPPAALSSAYYQMPAISQAAPLGTSRQLFWNNSDSIPLEFGSANTNFTIPGGSGQYFIVFGQWGGTVGVLNGVAPTASIDNGSITPFAGSLPGFGTLSTQVLGIWVIVLNNPSADARITFAADGVLPSGTTQLYFGVTQSDARATENY